MIIGITIGAVRMDMNGPLVLQTEIMVPDVHTAKANCLLLELMTSPQYAHKFPLNGITQNTEKLFQSNFFLTAIKKYGGNATKDMNGLKK